MFLISFIFILQLTRYAETVKIGRNATEIDYKYFADDSNIFSVDKSHVLRHAKREENTEKHTEEYIDVMINGFYLDSNEASRCEEGVVQLEVSDHRSFVYAFTDTMLRLYGRGLEPSTAVSFTTKEEKRGEDCTDLRSTEVLYLSPLKGSMNTVALVNVSFSLLANQKSQVFYFCVKRGTKDKQKFPLFVHQGTDKWVQLVVITRPFRSYMMPMWLQITMVVSLLVFSGLFSGLNLGLMSLNVTELNILVNSGSASEKKYAKTILPLRKKGNFLLCSILLGNVLVNNTLAILLDDLTMNGALAIVGATIAIVIFGEIIPQSICSRYGLLVGARTIWFTKLFMVLTFPLSYPISMVLDCVLGKELGHVFTRNRLRELIKQMGDETDLESVEVRIITGALELSKKTIGSVMTKIENMFMLDQDSTLDFETLTRISKTGYSRVPVYQHHRHTIVALLNVRDLTFVNPCDCTPLHTLISSNKHPLHFFPADTTLDVVLHIFKAGIPHMAFVVASEAHKVAVGVITLKDIIEEIFQSKILDEFDLIYNKDANCLVERPVLEGSLDIQEDHMCSQLAIAHPTSPYKANGTLLEKH